METTLFASVEGAEFAFEGTFQIGLIRVEFDGRLDGKRVLFSFEEADELESVHGAGTQVSRGQALIRRWKNQGWV